MGLKKNEEINMSWDIIAENYRVLDYVIRFQIEK